MISRIVGFLSLLLGICVMGTPSPAWAISCDFTLTDLDFGVYDQVNAQPTNSTGSLTVTCQRGKKEPAQVRYNLSLGPSTDGSMNPRSLQGPNPTPLFYNVFTDTTRTQIWGNGNQGSTTVTGHIRPIKQNNTGSLTHIFYGRIFPLQPVLPGSYADSITLTIDF
jgi:spore coat protein U-like protein